MEGEARRAGDQAARAAAAAGVRLRAAEGIEDAERVAAVVEELWGPGQMPPSLVRAFGHAGSVILLAEPLEGGSPAGFVLGFLGNAERLHVHSHMLGVRPGWQDRGVGLALKLGQRSACLEAGIDEARWTFDPLVRRNARFNLVKLGAVAAGVLPGFYGEMDDRINRGDRSDRFDVRWPLASSRVDAAAEGAPAAPEPGRVVLDVDGRGHPIETGSAPAPGAVVRIPADHHGARAADPALGRAWRDASLRAFEACFAAGLQATWIGADGGYVFEEVGG
jgi:predicted GNAT superfamily acetyltransferase